MKIRRDNRGTTKEKRLKKKDRTTVKLTKDNCVIIVEKEKNLLFENSVRIIVKYCRKRPVHGRNKKFLVPYTTYFHLSISFFSLF